MEKVRAKFFINHIQKSEIDGGINVMGNPVTTGSEENKAFSDYTPGGSLQLNIAAGKPAQEFFEVGKEYYLDFTRAD